MESVGAFPDVEWDSIMRMLNPDQGFDSFGQYPFSHEHDDNFVISCSSLAGDGANSGLQYVYQETSLGSGCSSTRVSAPASSAECYYFNDCGGVGITNNTYMSGEKCSSFSLPYPHSSMEDSPPVDECHDRSGNPCGVELKRKFDLNTAGLSVNPKKKPRASRAVQKSPKSNKTNKVMTNGKDEDESDVVPERQSSSSCSSEEDVELNRVELETPLKTRASRGSATDPQSLYARKRREKINERLKVLQNLVPNGTKVDIITMLEEAVDYVKFLQLQIKLLSSDDMWMYAPIAYNGMDLGLNGKMSPASL